MQPSETTCRADIDDAPVEQVSTRGYHRGARLAMLPMVSVIVPTFREAENLPHLVSDIEAVRGAGLFDLELIVVDDNSDDGTREWIENAGLEWVRLLERRGQRGLGTAVLAGLREARGDVLVVMDADLSHPARHIPDLVRLLDDGADFAIGSRYADGGSTDARWSIWRRANSLAATLLARPFTRVRDPMSGYFALRKNTFDRAAMLHPIGYKIGLELIVKCRCRDVRETPIHFHERTRGHSKLTMREQLAYVRHVTRLLWWMITHRG